MKSAVTVVNCQLSISNYQLPITNYQLPITYLQLLQLMIASQNFCQSR
ncbi:MAG: alpha/beta hydrolase [Oscillatoriales cyanobacterium RU_3_3]|nr:alpha/beta hydrolase [Microcoleus sp. SU_5_6]NJM62635.1 alpha/beta hydrolase [Oscillatoriales cyanobacterium RU_3_3]